MQLWLSRPPRMLPAAVPTPAAAAGPRKRRRGGGDDVVAVSVRGAPAWRVASPALPRDGASDADALVACAMGLPGPAPSAGAPASLAAAFARFDAGAGVPVAWAAHTGACGGGEAHAAPRVRGGAVAAALAGDSGWPMVHAIAPAHAAGPVEVTVLGERFRAAGATAAAVCRARGGPTAGRAVVEVYVGGTRCGDVRVVSDTAATATVPAGACGDVVVVRAHVFCAC